MRKVTKQTVLLLIYSLISRMLVREPRRRITLEAIMSHPWLQLGRTPLLPTPIPLVTEMCLTPEEYKRVVERMESGNIANRETIQR